MPASSPRNSALRSSASTTSITPSTTPEMAGMYCDSSAARPTTLRTTAAALPMDPGGRAQRRHLCFVPATTSRRTDAAGGSSCALLTALACAARGSAGSAILPWSFVSLSCMTLSSGARRHLPRLGRHDAQNSAPAINSDPALRSMSLRGGLACPRRTRPAQPLTPAQDLRSPLPICHDSLLIAARFDGDQICSHLSFPFLLSLERAFVAALCDLVRPDNRCVSHARCKGTEPSR